MIKRANILTNSFWYGIEKATDLVVGIACSVMVARVIGPERLGQFAYLLFLTSVAEKLAGIGTSAAAKKYVSEYLAQGQPGLVRAVFFETLRTQSMIAVAVPALGVAVALLFGDPAHLLVACLLIAAIAPSFISSIAALTNVAAENFSRNVPGALMGSAAYATAVTAALVFDWGLVGLASAVLIRRTLEMVVRIVPAVRWARRLPLVRPPAHLKRKLLTFSGQTLVVMAVTVVVWDRFEFVVLKQFCDVREVAFYSVAFGLSEYLTMLPFVIAGAVGAAVMRQYATDPVTAGQMADRAMRQLSLIVVPMHLGVASLSAALIPVVYGSEYLPAIGVVSIAAVLAIAKTYYWFPYTLFAAADKQSYLMNWLAIGAVVTVTLDFTLIPPLGAMGAALGNGISQAFAVVMLWRSAGRLCGVKFSWGPLVRVIGAGLAMAAAVLAIALTAPPLAAVPAGVAAGAVVYLFGIRLFRAVNPDDAAAIRDAAGRLPFGFRSVAGRLIAFASGGRTVSGPPAVTGAAVGPGGGLREGDR